MILRRPITAKNDGHVTTGLASFDQRSPFSYVVWTDERMISTW